MLSRNLILASTICLPLVASCTSVQDAAPVMGTSARVNTQSINVYLGQRAFDEDDFAPVEDQPTLGVEYVTQAPGAAVGWEFGLLGSSDDESVFVPLIGDVDVDSSTAELYAGVRKTFNQQSDFQPYVGGGLSVMTVDFEGSVLGQVQSDDDTVAGLYLHAGINFLLTRSFALGLDYRVLFAEDVELFDVEGDSNYGQFALTLGFGF